MYQIIPAILTNDINEYRKKITIFENIVSRVQIDIIDGEFAKNRTIGVKEIASIKTSIFLEAHLMTDEPEKYIEDLVKTNIRSIIVHVESCKDNIDNILDKIHLFGIEGGVAINPETPVKKIKNIVNKTDLILIMGVHPGFSGQKFIPQTLEKIKALRKISSTIPIGVDGGINKENIKEIIQAGANYLVIGSSLFKNGADGISVRKTLEELNEKIVNLKQKV